MRFTVLFIGLVLMGCTKTESCGFGMSQGHRISWGKHVPVDVFIDNSVPDYYIKPIENAAQVWNKAAGRQIIRIVDYNSGNGVYYVRNWQGNPDQQAVTHTRYGELGSIRSSFVEINANHILDRESLMIHEFGHVLGLSHSDQGVMFPTLRSSEIRHDLSSQDIANLKCEY